MKIPPGHTEQSVVEAIEKVVSVLAPSFVFGYFSLEDIQQEGRFEAIKSLDASIYEGQRKGYDPSRPLENYLYIIVRSRLLNFQRNKLRRNDPPCRMCHAGNPCGNAEGGSQCAKYAAWFNRNRDKANILRPLDINYISDEKEKKTRIASSVHQEVELDEMLKRIDCQLPVDLRTSYLQMRAGVPVGKARRLQVERAVKDILQGAIECPSEAD